MKLFKKVLTLFALFTVVAQLPAITIQSTGNYYEVLGIKENAAGHEINRVCTIKKTAIKQKKVKLSQVEQIDRACATLQNLDKKAQYDKNLKAEQASKSDKIAENIKTKCDRLKKEVTDKSLLADKKLLEKWLKDNKKGTSLPDKEEGVQNELANIYTKIQKIMDDCTLPEEFKPTNEVSAVRSKVNWAREKNLDVKVTNILGEALASIPIPDAGGKVFGHDMAIKDMTFIKSPSGKDVRQGLGFTGTMQFNKFNVKGTVFVVETTKHTFGGSVSMQLPDHYKLSNMFPSFKKLDALSLPKGKLVLSSFDYTDPDGFTIKRGLNFVAGLELSGPIKILNDIKNKAKQLRSVVVGLEPVRFQGVIPPDVSKTEFSATIPLRLGIDFTKIPKMPTSVSKIFKQLTTDDFEFAVTAPPKVSFTVEGGVRLVLGTQPDPLRLNMFGVIEPTNLTVGIRLRNMLELKYLALGNAGVQVDFDEALMPAAALLGIPFTGLGLNGEIDLGTVGDKRVNMKIGGGIRVTSSGIPDFMLDAEASNIQFKNLLVLYNKVAKKAGIPGQIPESKIPEMTIHKVKGYLALEDVKIARKVYDAGFQLAVDAQLFDKKFGFDFDLKHKQMTCSGSGYMSKIDVVINKKNIFSLSGPGPDRIYGNEDDGPFVYFDFNAKNIAASTFGFKTTVDIPAIKLKSLAEMEYSNGAYKSDFEMTYEGFTGVFGMNLDPKKLKETMIKFGFKGDFEKFLSKQALPALNALKAKANEKFAAVDKKIGELSKEINKARSQGTSSTQKEIDKTRATIKTIKGKIKALQKECDDASKVAKVVVCPKVGAEISAQGTALAAQETYLNTLLKPGKVVIDKSLKSLTELSKKISDAELTRKAVTGLLTGISKAIEGIAKGLNIFKVTKAIGEFSAAELAQGKMPKLTALEAEVNIPDVPSIKVKLANVQFNFKKPKESAIDIAKKLVNGIKID